MTSWLTGSATCCLTKVKEIHESFSTLNTLAVVSHVYAYFILLSCCCMKRREIMNLMNIETVISQRFLCGVNREMVVWIVKLWSESWNSGVNREIVAWIDHLLTCFVILWGDFTFLREWPLSATVYVDENTTVRFSTKIRKFRLNTVSRTINF